MQIILCISCQVFIEYGCFILLSFNLMGNDTCLQSLLPIYQFLTIKSILALEEPCIGKAHWLINFQNLQSPMLLSGLLKHNDLTVPECNTTLSTSCLLLSGPNVSKLISCQTGINTLQTQMSAHAHKKCQNEERNQNHKNGLTITFTITNNIFKNSIKHHGNRKFHHFFRKII